MDESRRVELGNQARRDVDGYTWLERGKKIMGGFME
jgi:hypothetical protein